MATYLGVTIADEGGRTVTVSAQAAVADAPLSVTGRTLNATKAAPTGTAVLATFTDPSGAEAVANYSATLDWGDGSGTDTTGSISYNSSTGVFTVSGSHSYALAGSYTVTVAITHDQAVTSVQDATTVYQDPTVVNTNDSGPGSLRKAIIDANYLGSLNGGTTTIAFAIPSSDPGYRADPVHGVSWFTIQPLSALPAITNAAVIDGYTQAGASPNTLAVGDNAVLKIDLDGSGIAFNGNTNPSITSLLQLGDGVTVRGLAINKGSGAGVFCFGAGDDVSGDFLGTDVTGAVAEGNTGFDVFAQGSDATIGGTTPDARNLISGSLAGPPGTGWVGEGVGDSGSGDVIEGNYIGTDASGTKALANAAYGVSAEYATNLTIGGTSGAAGNVISGNLAYNVSLYGSAGVTIRGNPIGPDATGEHVLSSGFASVFVAGNNTGTVIGGTDPGAGNVVSGNGNVGIRLAGSGSEVQGNLIGTDWTGTKALGNGSVGIYAWDGASNNTIGGTTPGARNVISGNFIGIAFSGSQNLVEGNLIGTDISGTAPLGNTGTGVWIAQGSNNTVGGAAAGAGNTISFNGGHGVAVSSGVGNSILSNSIHDNAYLEIFVDSTANANDNQAAPVLTSATSSGPGTTVSGTLASVANTTFRIEFFSNPGLDASGNAEGQTYLGFATVAFDAGGNPSSPDGSATVSVNTSGLATFTATQLATIPVGQGYLTSTATNLNTGDTSAFSKDLPPLTTTALVSSGNPSVYNQAVTFTATVAAPTYALAAPSGSVDFVDATAGVDLGSVPLSSGSASLTLSNPAVGTHAIEAIYSGDSTFRGSNSTLLQVVNKATPAVSVADAGGTYNGGAFAATATVTGVDGQPVTSLEGVGLTLDYQQLDGQGNIVADLGAAAPTAAGRYKVTASFAGSTDYTSAGGSATFNIAQATPAFSAVGTTVITDGTPSVTLSDTLSDGSLIPTGSVTVTLDGISQTVAIGAGGAFSATFATASLSVGAHTISFRYGGDLNFTDASARGSLDDTYGVLALFNQGRAAHPGSTLRVQLALASASGQDVSSGGVAVTALGIAATTDTTDTVGATDPSNVGTLTPAPAASGSNPGNAFQFQGGAHPSYTYNLKIPDGLAAGTYRLYFSIAGDPLDHWVTFVVQ